MPSSKLIKPLAVIQQHGETEEEAKLRAHWKGRVCVNTPAATGLGMMVRAVLGRGRRLLPRLGVEARISPLGVVHADFWDYDGRYFKDDDLGFGPGEPMTPVRARDEFRRLADRLMLNDTERTELMSMLQKWMGKDERPEHRHVEIGR